MTNTLTEAPTEPVGPSKVKSPRRRRIDLRQYGILAALAVIILLFEILTGGRLLMPGNVNNLIQQNSYVLILAIGMVIVIIAGHIDLSVGSVVALVGAVAALAMNNWGLPWWAAVLLSLVVGAVIGAWQGFWVAFVGIPAFIVTLAGMLIFRGLTLVLLTGGTISGLPAEFTAIGAGWVPDFLGEIGGRDTFTLLLGLLASAAFIVQVAVKRRTLKKLELPREPAGSAWAKSIIAVVAVMALAWLLSGYSGTPIILIILAALILLYTFVLNRSTFGRHVYAMGGNRFAAEMSGIKTRWVDFGICQHGGAGGPRRRGRHGPRGQRGGVGRSELRAGCDRRGLHRRRGRAGWCRHRRGSRDRWPRDGRAQHGSVHPVGGRGVAAGHQGPRAPPGRRVRHHQQASFRPIAWTRTRGGAARCE